MVNKEETIILIVFTLLALLIIAPHFWGSDDSMRGSESETHTQNGYEGFSTDQQLSIKDDVRASDPDFHGQKTVHPKGKITDYESLIYDNTTGAIMTGSQFMENTGIIAPLWIPPAWDPDAYGPSSKGELDPADYENDPRMLYNKCSLSCCSPQYPTPFKGDKDPFVCDKKDKSKYLASDYVCQNNTGGVGCLCMTEKQVDGMGKGFVDYYVDKENLGW